MSNSVEIPLSREQEIALAACLDDRFPFVFLTGKAGTGKSVLTRRLRKEEGTLVAGTTGIAALNIGGPTLHSLAKIPARLHSPEDGGSSTVDVLQSAKRLVIDEFPMARADTVDYLDRTLRKSRKSQKPFGGLKVIGVGDCWQLPPVVTEDERSLFESFYDSPWWFEARVMKELEVRLVELSEVFRQTDKGFLQFLDRARLGQVPETWIARLNEVCSKNKVDPAASLTLTTLRKSAEATNERQLAQVNGEAKKFVAVRKGEFAGDREQNLPAPEVLTLKIGARVISCANQANGMANGSSGVVVGFGSDYVTVKPDGFNHPVEVEAYTWEKLAYSRNGKSLVVNTTGSYKQIPLLLGWSVTTHRAQGMSLSTAIVDLGRGTFASGQGYVALSRVRSLQGLALARPLRTTDFIADPRVEVYMEQLRAKPTPLGGLGQPSLFAA